VVVALKAEELAEHNIQRKVRADENIVREANRPVEKLKRHFKAKGNTARR
jgi:hypothetical protein